MKKITAMALVLSACGPSSPKEEITPPSDRPINPIVTPTPIQSPKPLPGQRFKYRPAWLSAEWSDNAYFISGGEPGNTGILPGEEPIADSIFRYWEAVRSNWSKTINVGLTPKEYLQKTPSGFDQIVWTDKTDGKIQGFEKLKVTLSEMQTRCPQLSDKSLQAPLEVVWATEKETFAPGQFSSNRPWLLFEKDRVAFDANTNSRPLLNVRAEWIRDMGNGYSYGWKWPDQTFKEQTGGKAYADGGFAEKSVDETFAHEFGHYIVQAWALNYGRSNLQSQHFAEGFAELFRTVCWGGPQDNIKWVANDITSTNMPRGRIKTYQKSDHRFSRSGEYALDSLGDVISWKQSKGEYDTAEFFGAMLKTLEDMQGRIIRDYPVISPVDGILTDTAPWTNSSNFVFPQIKNDAPMMLTRQEFVEKFCDNYDCGDIKDLLLADAEGLRRDEW